MKLLLGLIPISLGAFAVLQAGLNRKVAAQWGLISTVFLNSLVLFSSASLLLLLARFRSEWFPQGFKIQMSLGTFSPWFLIPGLCGFSLVLGAPWSISRWGATVTFVALLSSQLLMSVLWDIQVEQIPISNMRLAGVVCAWLGVLLVTLGK